MAKPLPLRVAFEAVAYAADPQLRSPSPALPALTRQVDFVAQVRRQQGTALLLVEFQTEWTAAMPERMAEYTLRLHLRHREPVLPVVEVLRPGGALEPR